MTTGFWVLYYSFVASSIHYVFIVSRREDLNRKTLPVSLNSWICLPESLMWLKIKQCSYFHFQEHFALCGNAAKTKYCSRGYLQQPTATSMCIQLCLICGGQNSLVSFTLDFFFKGKYIWTYVFNFYFEHFLVPVQLSPFLHTSFQVSVSWR